MSHEFYFPLKREQIIGQPSDDRFYIEDERIIIEDSNEPNEEFQNILEQINETLEQDSLNLYDQKVFRYMYSLFYSFPSVSDSMKNKLLTIFSKAFGKFYQDVDQFLDLNFEEQQNQTSQMRNVLKMYVFFTDWLIEIILQHLKSKQKEIKGRRKMKGIPAAKDKKKTTKKKKEDQKIFDSDGESIGDPSIVISKIIDMIEIITHLCELNIKFLFKNKIIEDDIPTLFIKISFDCLEISLETKTLQNKEKIFNLLQLLITKFQSNTNIQLILLKLTAKIVNLIYTQEQLVIPLSEFITLAIKGDNNLNKMAVDIIQEVSKTVNEDKNFDSQGIKNVGRFLVYLSENSSKTMYNNMTILIPLFDSESYIIRNSLVEIIANVIIKILCNTDEIDDVETRTNYMKTKENFIEILFDRIYDKVGFCRAKVLTIFEKLSENNTLSVSSYFKLLTETCGRLRDEKSIVRKRALSLIARIISVYAAIFKCQKFLSYSEVELNIKNTEHIIEELEAKIKEIEENSKQEINALNQEEITQIQNNEVENEEKNQILEDIQKNQMVKEYFQNYNLVLKNIDSIIPIIGQLLGSKNISDVQESIDLFIVLHKFRISSAIFGIKKMLTLIMKPEPSIKKKIIEAYKQLYFNSDYSFDVQAAFLVELASSLNPSEYECLRELLKSLISEKLINLSVFKDIWKIMIKHPENEIDKIKASSNEEMSEKLNQIEIESLSALKLINICSEFEPSILTNNAELYINNISVNLSRRTFNWNIIKESLIGLQRIHHLKKDITENCLLKITKKILHEYGKNDNNWFLVVKELITTIFNIIAKPEKVVQFLIIKLSKPFFNNTVNKDEKLNNKFLTQNILSQNNMDIDTDNQNNSRDDSIPINQNMTPLKLAHLFFVIGHVALNMVIYSEKLEANLKRQILETTTKKSNLESRDDINEIIGGKEADYERNLQLLHHCLDEQLLYNNLLSKFVPLIVSFAKQSLTCSNKEIETNALLYKSAILALSKLMLVNKKFCEENLPFMFELLASDTINANIKLNVCVAFGDFINRFPNILQNNINKLFKGLHSTNQELRRYTMIVISHLVLSDLLKLKGEIVDIVMLLDDDDAGLKELISIFLNEMNLKGSNQIYNIIPKALARISNEFKSISYEKFQNITKTLFKYIEKDKQTEGLIDRLINKLKETSDLNEWKNTTYCLTLLNYNNDKLISKFIEEYSSIKIKNDSDKTVLENLAYILSKMKKSSNISQSTKQLLEDAEVKILKGEKFTFPKDSKKLGKRSRKKAFKENSENSSVNSESNEKGSSSNQMSFDESESSIKSGKGKSKVVVRTNIKKRNKKKAEIVIEEEPEEIEDDE